MTTKEATKHNIDLIKLQRTVNYFLVFPPILAIGLS